MEIAGDMKYLYEKVTFYRQMIQCVKRSIEEVLGKKHVVKIVEDRLDKILQKIWFLTS